MSIPGRALHYVFKIGKRAETMHFFREVLGMKVLRHEEFTQGCDAACNGPYDNRWSKTMVGYGPESSHFVIELTYNYGITAYELGNDFQGITIRSSAVAERIRAAAYPHETRPDGRLELSAPDGYRFTVLDQPEAGGDPVLRVALSVTDLGRAVDYWHGVLAMELLEREDARALLAYGTRQAQLELVRIAEPLDRAKAYGRIAFGVPWAKQEEIDAAIRRTGNRILTELITLETPGKANVRVIILADPDGHEICFVDEEGFGQLSEVDPDGERILNREMKKDPFEKKKE